MARLPGQRGSVLLHHLNTTMAGVAQSGKIAFNVDTPLTSRARP
ncbi:MAG: hypothetical protein ACLSUM_00795 [Dysosmobacter welbionis]